MTTQDLYTRFQALYQETSTRYFTDAWAVEVINDSVRDVYDEVTLLNKELLGQSLSTIGYVANTREYNLPSGLVSVSKVEVTDLGGPPYPTLTPIPFTSVGDYTMPTPTLPQWAAGGVGEPMVYYVRGPDPSSSAQVIGFDPIPSRTASTQNVNIWYEGLPSLVSTIDTSTQPDLPPDFHRLVPLRMCVLAAAAEGSPRLPFYTTLYNSALGRTMTLAAKGRQSARRSFRVVG